MPEDTWLQHWDDVIVGGGSSGATLAARLSQDPQRSVLLLEAGVDRLGGPEDSYPLGMSVLSGYNWDYTAYMGTEPKGRRGPYGVGKLLGGSSAVNGAIALRGLAADFDSWAAGGSPEWAWEAVLPYFRALETDADFTDSAHGSAGPVPVRRPAIDEFDPVALAFLDACKEQGIPHTADMNTGAVGAGPLPSNARDGRRISAAEAYLEPARHRPNLGVWTRTEVSRVLFEGNRAVGVEALREGRPAQVRADRVTLCAGGINTPLILERSGIGGSRRLASLGVPVVADLPGVGEDLADHVATVVWAVPRPGVCRKGVPWHQVMARVAHAGGAPGLGVFLASNVTEETIPEVGKVTEDRIAVVLSAMLLDPASRGAVHVSGAGPDDPPVITLGLLSERTDVERLMAGTRLLWSLLNASAMTQTLRQVLLWTERMVQDEERLRKAVRRFATPMWHPSGTARMGPSGDASSVVDQYCRVHQVERLRVVDSSIIPSPLLSPMNLSCIMLAERVAAWMA
ncbi:GMC family oxidoreductase N-terminal domain-containing protein [Streptomyces sp. NPDC048109]|uniref:GMC family oxidoreductase n=1 Tax=Streptomyces sp. NPDC048109 TaxID=3155482 RepID=UPI003421BC13